VSPGWADVSPEKLQEWKMKGLELRGELESVAQEVMSVEYGRLMRKVRACVASALDQQY